MRLFLAFSRHPTPLVDGADDRLPSGMDVDVLNRNLLLAFTAIALQRLFGRQLTRQRRIEAATCRNTERR